MNCKVDPKNHRGMKSFEYETYTMALGHKIIGLRCRKCREERDAKL